MIAPTPELWRAAAEASHVPMCLSDPHAPDQPLIWVNRAFETVTGYSAGEAVGRNCRFLQGAGTDPEAVARIRTAVRSGAAITEILLNHRRDGSPFWNRLSLSPLRDADGRLTHYVGIQDDVTAQIDADRARDEALRSADAVNDRLRRLSSVSEDLAGRVARGRDLLAEVPAVVARHAECWVALVTPDETGGVAHVVIAGPEPASDAVGSDASTVVGRWLDDGALTTVVEATAGGPWPVVLETELALPALPAASGVPGGVPAGPAPYSVAGVALAGWSPVAVLALFVPGPAAFDDEMLAGVADLGLRVGSALDNARLHQADHDAALAFQTGLLPRLARVDGFEVAARYLPSTAGAQVGGDWYDLVERPDGTLAVTVGDVMGHDFDAAAAMGQLRAMLRALAWRDGEPDRVLCELGQLGPAVLRDRFATVALATLQRDGDAVSMAWNRAGHLPPIVVDPDGRVTVLAGPVAPPVGVGTGDVPPPERADVPVGSTLVLYTDGLVERRDRELDDGIAALVEVLAAHPRLPVEQLRDLLVDTLVGPTPTDDTCLVLVRPV